MDIQAEKLLLIEQLLRTDDVKVLAEVRELLSKKINQIEGYDGADSKFWLSLTEEQRQDILAAYEESRDRRNLISREDFFKKRL